MLSLIFGALRLRPLLLSANICSFIEEIALIDGVSRVKLIDQFKYFRRCESRGVWVKSRRLTPKVNHLLLHRSALRSMPKIRVYLTRFTYVHFAPVSQLF